MSSNVIACHGPRLALSLWNLPCQISQGNKIVEVASLAVRKGIVVTNALQQQLVWKLSPAIDPLNFSNEVTLDINDYDYLTI